MEERATVVDLTAVVVAVTGEQPRVLFLHYWGVGKAADLAGAVVGALKETRHDNAP